MISGEMKLGTDETFEVWFLPSNRESYYPPAFCKNSIQSRAHAIMRQKNLRSIAAPWRSSDQ